MTCYRKQDDICFLTVGQLHEAVRSRQVSPVEVVKAFFARIERLNPALNAYVTLCEEEALIKAREAERVVAAGDELGPLHGVPVAIKDLYDLKAGVPNTFGSKVFKDSVPGTTAIQVERLEEAGAIVLGKTNTCEFGIKCLTDNLLFGATSTPFAPGKNAGGSSGGSAAAVAAGLACAAIGGDTVGSVRAPAAWCGVVGHKPTSGRVASVSRPDAFTKQTPFGSSGPLTRTVEDAALMMDVLSGPDRRDPLCLPDDGIDWLGAVGQRRSSMRLAYSPNLGIFPVEREVLEIVDSAVEALGSAGFEVEVIEADLPGSQRKLAEVAMQEVAVNCAVLVERYRRSGLDLLGEYRNELTPEFVELVEVSIATSAVEYRLLDTLRTEIVDAFAELFDLYDAVLTPTLAVTGVDNRDDGLTIGPTSVNGEPVNAQAGWCLTYPANLTGHPAASVPVGFTSEGVPVGVQVMSQRFADDLVLKTCAIVEEILPWQSSYGRIDNVLSAGT